MDYEIHHAATLFPMMPDSELGELAADIKNNGLLEPIALWEGKVIDGRNRLEACRLAGVEPTFTELNTSTCSPVVYVLSKNLHRRQLTSSQRAAIAAEATPMLQEEARKRQEASRFSTRTAQRGRSSVPDAPVGAEIRQPQSKRLIGRVSAIAGDALNVSRRQVERAIRIKREAPEEFERIKSGEVTIDRVERALSGRVSKADKPDVAATFMPTSKRQKEVANKQKSRMVAALSEMSGFCRGIQELHPSVVVSVCDAEEVSLWADRANELASILNQFSKKLKGAFSVKGSVEREGGAGEGRQSTDSPGSAAKVTSIEVKQAS